jgi:DNA-binding transcriptional regulator YiaG
MTPAELRASLTRLNLSQVGAARLLNVDPRTMRRWISGEIAVPGPVVVLLDLMEHCAPVLDYLKARAGKS